jgi:hypothetical protein
MFSSLYSWLAAGEMTGRFVFDLGQSLYEGGRPVAGRIMMQRGLESTATDPAAATADQPVSTGVMRLRIGLDYPVVPSSVLEIIEAYLNITTFLSESAGSYQTVDLENVMDVYWPLPLLYWSALPVASVVREVMWRFSDGPVRTDELAKRWLDRPLPLSLHPSENLSNADVTRSQRSLQHTSSRVRTESNRAARDGDMDDEQGGNHIEAESESESLSLTSSSKERRSNRRGSGGRGLKEQASSISSSTSTSSTNTRKATPPPPSGDTKTSRNNCKKNAPNNNNNENKKSRSRPLIELGIFGGHMNSHPVGQSVLHRLLALVPASDSSHSHSHVRTSSISGGGSGGAGPTAAADRGLSRDKFRLTLLALGLRADSTTSHTAGRVDRIVNLPADTTGTV